MEDLVARVHAQQLVAAALYLGTKGVRRAIQRHFANRRCVELRIDGVAHDREMVQQLQIRTGDTFRRALRDHAAAIGQRVSLSQRTISAVERRFVVSPFLLERIAGALERFQERVFNPAAAEPL